MQDSQDHIPEYTRQELELLQQILRDTVQPEMIILFGSYARGDWVAEKTPDGVHYQYQSDLDILVVTETESQAARLETNTPLNTALSQRIKTPVSLIAHDIQFLNRRLKKGQYFFTDIQKEGILLYSSGRYTLEQPRELHPRERKLLATDDFDYWFGKALKLKKGFQLYFDEGDYSEAVFLLHQMTERFLGAILLVFTRYKPNTHDLGKLLKRASSIEPRMLSVFPQGSEQECECFQLLKKAYVDARYKPSYHISRDQLAWLAERVAILEQMTKDFCNAKIASFDQ